jgi:phytoene synthase
MRSDLTRTRFTSWQDFLEYAEGASVAPTTIYLSLILANGKAVTEPSRAPTGFDLYACGRHLGVFAYLGHIVRDLAKDIRNEGEPLLYFTEDDMRAHGVSLSTLTSDAARGLAGQRTRHLVGELLSRGRAQLKLGRSLVKRVEEQIEDDSRFILELITTLYEVMIAKIAACGNDPMGDRHWLTEGEKTQVVREAAARTGYMLP